MTDRIEITDWREHYETTETRKLVRLRWVPLPNGMGRGYAKLLSRHGFMGLGVWAALLEIASRKHRDRRNGVIDYPLEDIALESRGDLRELREVLPTLQEIGWIAPFIARSAESPGIAAEPADEGKGREGKEGREGNGTEPATPGRKKPEPGPQDALARRLASALGSSLAPCRKQIAALRAAGMTLDEIEPCLSLCMPGMAPWDWTKKVTGQDTKRKGLTPQQLLDGARKLREQGR